MGCFYIISVISTVCRGYRHVWAKPLVLLWRHILPPFAGGLSPLDHLSGFCQISPSGAQTLSCFLLCLQSSLPGSPCACQTSYGQHDSRSQIWKQPKCPLTDEWIHKLWSIHTGEYYSALKMKETLTLATSWMNYEDIKLWERNQHKRTNAVWFHP